MFAPGKVYEDAHGCVTLHLEREFDRLTVSQPARDENSDSGRVLLYRAEIVSDRFGRSEKPLVQAVCGDAWFAAEFLVPNRLAAETVFDWRDGAGAWLMRALKILHARRFISAAPSDAGGGDDVWKKYPQLAGVPTTLVPEMADSAGATVYGVSCCAF